jgi:hypothetical protein
LIVYLGVESREMGSLWFEGLYDFGDELFWLRASMTGGGRSCSIFNYALAFAFQLRKSTENLS